MTPEPAEADLAPGPPTAGSAAGRSPSVRLRRALDGIPAYVPGRGVEPQPDVVTYKISSNENPYPPLPAVQDVVAQAAAQMNRYPDMFATGLVRAIAERFAVSQECVVTGTGSVGVLGQIVTATCEAGDEVVYAWRSFEAYPIVVQAAGAVPVPVPLTADCRHDLAAMADAVTERTRLVLVCTPNNPTGPSVRTDELAAFLDRVPRDVLVVIDEAYVEFVRDRQAPDALALQRSRPNVAVLRTFSKAYGLAGLRVGFAIADPPVAAALRKTAVPFGVSAVAQAAAVASLAAEGELRARVASLIQERSRVLAALREQGWDVPPSEANFVWFAVGERTDDFARMCGQAGLVVRPFAGEGVRATISEAAANDRLIAVAMRFLADQPATSSSGDRVPT
jgi:histidinol-phosphate aminotransferase